MLLFAVAVAAASLTRMAQGREDLADWLFLAASAIYIGVLTRLMWRRGSDA